MLFIKFIENSFLILFFSFMVIFLIYKFLPPMISNGNKVSEWYPPTTLKDPEPVLDYEFLRKYYQ